ASSRKSWTIGCYKSYGREGEVVSAKDRKMEQLRAELRQLYCSGQLDAAKKVANQLARILGSPTPASLKRHMNLWTLIWEAQGNILEAIRLQNRDLSRQRAALAAGAFDSQPKLLADAIKNIQDALCLQIAR